MTRFIAKLVILALFSSPLWAACPSGVIQNLNVTLASIGVTNCFYVASTGSDANAGTSEGSPWLHDPKMQAATGNAASHTVAAGDGFIFRGGDTWHFSSGTPLRGSSWTMTTAGTSGNQIYRGVDTTWFNSGTCATWCRPILSYDNPLSVNQVASCSFANSGQFLSNSGAWNIFDNFELTGYCWDVSGSVVVAMNFSSTNQNVVNNYFHGWTEATSATGDVFRMLGCGASGVSNTRCAYNVFDGSDSTFGTRYTLPSGQCTSFPNEGVNCATTTGVPTFANAGGTGWAISGSCYQVDHSIFRHTSNAMECNGTIVHDNLFEYNFEPGNSVPHGNIYEALQGASGPFYFYNNIARNNNIAVSWWLTCTDATNTCYVFNNVAENDWHNGGAANGNCIMFSPNGGSNVIGTVFFVHNTIDETCGTQAVNAVPHFASGSTFTFQNSHFVGSGTTVASRFTCSTGNICSVVNNNGEVFQTTAVANGQGYALTNDYAPTLIGNSRVTAGVSDTTFCGGLVDAGAQAACANGTSKGVSEVAGSGGFVASSPAITVNPRPGTPDSGAYQFVVASISQTINGVVQMSGSAVMK